jgi:hypothetical protein
MRHERDQPGDYTGNPKHDAYMQWGIKSGFLYFNKGPKGNEVGVLFEWNSVADAESAYGYLSGRGVVIPGVYFEAPDPHKPNPAPIVRVRCALGIDPANIEGILGDLEGWLSRADLAEAVTPTSRSIVGTGIGFQSTTTVLAGVLDDGCPFLNSRFTTNQVPRVLAIWNQDSPGSIDALPLDGQSGPTALADFGYGEHFTQRAIQGLATEFGSAQDSCYRECRFDNLRREATHGAHIMDLLCGSSAPSPGGNQTGDAQIVFIQFPRAGIDDPSGKWLGRSVLDGMHYLLQCAGAPTRTIVANISWGPQTGPHDGNSILELALDDLVAEQPAGRELFITLAAGNSYQTSAHARISCKAGGDVWWIVPPGGTAPAFLEIWWPRDVDPAAVQLKITAPDGRWVNVSGPDLMIVDDRWLVILTRPVRQGAMALVAINPTGKVEVGLPGTHGRWHIQIASGASETGDDIEIYVARADPNMGAKRRAKASRLWDPALAKSRFLSPEDQLGESQDSVVRKAGTLTGLATGANTFVAAGYRYSDDTSAPYSSSGGTRGDRQYPDYACVTDISAALPGVRGTGVRSGTRVRLVGTSTAAPQMGRRLVATGGVPPVFQPPPKFDPLRMGEGCMDCDDEVLGRSKT